MNFVKCERKEKEEHQQGVTGAAAIDALGCGSDLSGSGIQPRVSLRCCSMYNTSFTSTRDVEVPLDRKPSSPHPNVVQMNPRYLKRKPMHDQRRGDSGMLPL